MSIDDLLPHNVNSTAQPISTRPPISSRLAAYPGPHHQPSENAISTWGGARAGALAGQALGGVLGVLMSFSVAARATAEYQTSIVLLGISDSLHPLVLSLMFTVPAMIGIGISTTLHRNPGPPDLAEAGEEDHATSLLGPLGGEETQALKQQSRGEGRDGQSQRRPRSPGVWRSHRAAWPHWAAPCWVSSFWPSSASPGAEIEISSLALSTLSLWDARAIKNLWPRQH